MKKTISILLCLVLMMSLFAGCSTANDPKAYMPTGEALVMDGDDAAQKAQLNMRQSMSLAYYPNASMNPLKNTDYTNRVLFPLIYQSLFAVNRDNEIVPILCKSYTVKSDLMTYTFTIDPRATFSDGSPVTAADVVASLKAAEDSSYYGGRLRYVNKIYTNDDDAVVITLKQAYENLPLLLDIPIVKKSQIKKDNPLGSGPYVFSQTGSVVRLMRRNNWWCETDDLQVTALQIPLEAAESITEVRDAFEFEDVGVVCTDPGSDHYVEYRCDYELWDCETGIFLYLGVNEDSSVFKKKSVRQALSKGIDRDLLVDNFYRGFALSAELPASPNSPYYTATLAQQYAYDQDAFLSAMEKMKGKKITLLVNKDDSRRVKVAQRIATMLNTSGLIVNVSSRSSEAYMTALEEGDYDLYLGQTRLSPNMDLTPFFSASGGLHYGGMDDLATYNLCLQALENQGNYYTLHQTVMDEGYLCPILFRSYAVYATRGLLTNLQPARDNLFFYTIGKTMTDAYTVQG